MAGFGSFLENAFSGYQMGIKIKDAKKKKEIDSTRFGWESEDRELRRREREEDRAWEKDERQFDRETDILNRGYRATEHDWAGEDRTDRKRAADQSYSHAEEEQTWDREDRVRTRAEQERTDKAAADERQMFEDVFGDAKDEHGRRTAPVTPRSVMPAQAQAPVPVAEPTHLNASPQPRSIMPAPGIEPAGRAAADMPQSFANDPLVTQAAQSRGIELPAIWAQMAPEMKEVYRQRDRAAQPATATAPQVPGDPIATAAAAQDKDPNVEAAEAGAVKARSVVKPGDRVTPQQRREAEDGFLETYREVAVPQIIEHYLRTGQVDKAQSFQTWLETSEAQKLQKEFGALTFTLAIGDLDGALDHMIGMYSHVNDGYEIVREKSGFETYDNGKPARLVVTFKDEDGNEFEQIVEGQGDLASQLLGLVNPQAAHEHLLQRHEQAVDAEVEARRKARTVITQESIMEEVKRLKDDLIDQEKNNIGRDPIPMPSDAELFQMAHDNLLRAQAYASGQAPAGAQAPMPDYRAGQ